MLHYDAGVDANGYKPVRFLDIVQKIANIELPK
jgi:calcineurin-like phosphoesterase family protein